MRFPPTEAFSPRDFADYLTFEIMKPGPSRSRRGPARPTSEEAPGIRWQTLENFFGKLDYLRQRFRLDVSVELKNVRDQDDR